MAPTAIHVTEQYANNAVGADHGRLEARLRPMRGFKRFRSARTLAADHALIQNIRRGHYELAVDQSAQDRVAMPSTSWFLPSDAEHHNGRTMPDNTSRSHNATAPLGVTVLHVTGP